MTFLITGATGDVGSRVVEHLLERGERPRVFVRDSAKAQCFAALPYLVDFEVGRSLPEAQSCSAAIAGPGRINSDIIVENAREE